LNFVLEFEKELFDEYGNTSNYYLMRKPQEPRKSSSVEPLDPSEEVFRKKTTKYLVSIMSDEWLEESELSPKVIRLDSPSTTIYCQLTRILSMLFTIRLWVSISCLQFLLMIY
jgi:hypothetical protein